MSETTQLGLPLLQPSQAQKHVTVNDAMMVLDTVVQLSVKDSVLNAPPLLPTEGDRYIVGPAPTGAWSGMARQVGAWVGGAWVFHQPQDGWIAWDIAAAKAVVFSLGNWQPLSSGALPNTLPELGINALPDATNKFVFSGTNSLMTSAGSIDLAVNKASAGNTASLTFKDGFSARALLGLLADDNFTLKVSANGSTFATPLVASGTTGKVATLLATSDGMTLSDGTDPTKAAKFSLTGLSTGTTRTFSLPDTSQTLAHVGTAAQTFAGAVTLANATASIGTSAANATYGIGNGATGSGATKTVDIGSAGVSGSSTVVNVGSSVAGAGGTLVVNSPTVTFANSVTAVGMPQATLAAGRVGIGGATADATNRLNVNSSNVLLNNAGSGIDIAVNKAVTGNDASVTFKNGFSTRALMGLLADDNFTLKVSANGSTFATPLIASAATGKVATLLATADGLTLNDSTDPTKAAKFSLTGLSTGTTRTYGLPDTSQTLAHIGTTAQSFAGPVTVAAASASIGTSVATATYALGNGATGSGSIKTIDIGTAGISGSTTAVNIGSSVAGAGGTLIVNSPTVTFANSVTAVGMPQANLSVGQMGIGGATADATNRLSINSSNALLNNAGAGIDLTLNKAASGNDGSLTFKTAFSPRALFGLLGSDDLTLKVSPDGTSFFDGLVVDRTSGRTTFPQGARLGPLVNDPASPTDGTIWYNSTATQVRARINGATRILVSDDIAFTQPGIGDFITTSMGSGSTTATAIGVAGRFDLFPFAPRGDVTCDQIAINVATAVAAAQGKVLIYASNALGQPTTRLFESAALDYSTIGFKTAAIAITFRKGQVYWIGNRHSSTATLTTFATGATPDLTTSDLTLQLRKVLRRTLTFATAAPDPWGYLSTETTNGSAVATFLRST